MMGISPRDSTWLGWTDEGIDTLLRLAAENKSGAEIADALGCSRSAVMGKASRLGVKLNGFTYDIAAHVARERDAKGVGFGRPPPRPPATVTVNPPLRSITGPRTVEALEELAQAAGARMAAVAKPSAASAPPCVAMPSPERQASRPQPQNIVRKADSRAHDPGFTEPAPRKTAVVCDAVPAAGSLTFWELTEQACKWPYNDPRDFDTFRFCGQPRPLGRPYCAGHAKLAPAIATSRHGTQSPSRPHAALQSKGF